MSSVIFWFCWQISPAWPLQLLCAGLHGYPVGGSADGQLAFVPGTSLSGVTVASLGRSLLQLPSVPSAAADGSRQMSAPSQAGSWRRRRRWAGLRQKWKLLGLFEIDQQHEFYTLTSLMKEGLATASQNPPEEEQPVSSSSENRDVRSLLTISQVETGGLEHRSGQTGGLQRDRRSVMMRINGFITTTCFRS